VVDGVLINWQKELEELEMTEGEWSLRLASELAERVYLFKMLYILAVIIPFSMGGGDSMPLISTRYKVKMHDYLEAAAAMATECAIPKLFGLGSKPHVLVNIPTCKAFYNLQGGNRGLYQHFSQALAQARFKVQLQIC
jgi:hypothetical protein